MTSPKSPSTLRLKAKPAKPAATAPRRPVRPGKPAIPHAAKPKLDHIVPAPSAVKPAAAVAASQPAASAPATAPREPKRAPPTAKPRLAKPRMEAPVPRSAKKAAPPQPAVAEGDRLAKRVAAMVPCSRSEAEQYIEGGWVRVDGKVVEEPQARVQHHTITIDPNASLLELNSITILLHKPADWVDGTEESLAKLNRNARRAHFDDARTLLTAANHMAKDPSDIRLLQRHFKGLSALVPIENAASGLIVFTQDWRIERKLSEELGSMEHEVIVDIAGEVSAQALHLLNRTLDSDENLPLVKVSINSTTPERSKLRFAIKGAHRGLIAHLCERAKLEILDMRRIRLGRVALSDLPVGQWRYLAPHEKF